MEKKIILKVCTGTACYVMGGAQLIVIEDQLPDDIKDMVQVEGCTCLDFCKDPEKGKMPFVLVNDHLISEATPLKVVEYISKLAETI